MAVETLLLLALLHTDPAALDIKTSQTENYIVQATVGPGDGTEGMGSVDLERVKIIDLLRLSPNGRKEFNRERYMGGKRLRSAEGLSFRAFNLLLELLQTDRGYLRYLYNELSQRSDEGSRRRFLELEAKIQLRKANEISRKRIRIQKETPEIYTVGQKILEDSYGDIPVWASLFPFGNAARFGDNPEHKKAYEEWQETFKQENKYRSRWSILEEWAREKPGSGPRPGN